MSDEKHYKWLTITAAVCMLALTIGFLFWLSDRSFPNRPEFPDSSEEVIVLVKDSTETQKWKAKHDSVYKKMLHWEAHYKRIKLQTSQIIKKNEAIKKMALSASDSIAVVINDSLRSRYAEIINKGRN